MGFNVIAAAGSIAAAKQASAMGKYNQQVQERNAQIAEQEKEVLEKRLEFDLARFDQDVQKLQGETRVGILKSGVVLSGTGLNILRYNAEQAEKEKNVMKYNSQVAQSQAIEKANFARIQGSLARQRGRAAATAYYLKAGTSLLRGANNTSGGSTGTSQFEYTGGVTGGGFGE
nr:internal virion protein B-like protein [uncultured Mediterranean phage uvMED]